MVDEALVILTSGDLRVGVSSAVGGAISSFRWIGAGGDRAILRACHSPLETVLDAASFPLVPFVNRIRDGRFDFRGREVRLAPNMAGDPSPLHGQGWLSSWQVEQQSEARAVLTFHHEAAEWPWDYDARQEFLLDSGGLLLRLSCRNRSAGPMPCGLGQHPYFDCGVQTRIAAEVTEVWTIDEHVLPVAKVPADGRFDLRDRPACGQGLDHGFGGWKGTAVITDPDWPYAVRLSSPDARFFQLYSPEAGGIFVAEPVTHANAALNAPEEQWAELGMRVLEPGEAMGLDMRLDVIPG